ncbi:MAG TPA: M23 family metallopeptidase [Thermoanaerobaculia bacterium]|nr:M23 family metallopeptidase [Thermoanaerobaculia bacterium]
MSWRRVLLRLAALALLLFLFLWFYPYLRHLPRVVKLWREPPPSSLPIPVEGVVASDLEDTWGAARSEGRKHEGIDIFAPRRTPIHSATQGVVVHKRWNRLGGRTVTVFGPAGWSHYYAHLDEWETPAVGDWVEVGTVLGYVGDSGNAQGTPTHLHYGIYVDGEARNPYPLLTPAPTPPASRSRARR